MLSLTQPLLLLCWKVFFNDSNKKEEINCQ